MCDINIYLYVYVKVNFMKNIYNNQVIMQILFIIFWLCVYIYKMRFNLEKMIIKFFNNGINIIVF